jgi:hypothetical protein
MVKMSFLEVALNLWAFEMGGLTPTSRCNLSFLEFWNDSRTTAAQWLRIISVATTKMVAKFGVFLWVASPYLYILG